MDRLWPPMGVYRPLTLSFLGAGHKIEVHETVLAVPVCNYRVEGGLLDRPKGRLCDMCGMPYSSVLVMRTNNDTSV